MSLTKTQLDYRKKGIGGTDAAGILGLSKYKTPLSIYLDKIGELDKPEENEYMYWGNVLENPVAEKFCIETGKKIRNINTTYIDSQYPFLLGNIDRKVLGEESGLEIKTCSEYRREEWDGKAPDEYVLQCQHYMMVTGLKLWYLAVLIGGNSFKYVSIDRDDALIKYLKEKEIDFWQNHVLAKKPPLPSKAGVDAPLLRTLFSDETETTVHLDSSYDNLMKEYIKLSEDMKMMAERKKDISNLIKLGLENNKVGEGHEYKAIWTKYNVNRVDTKKLKTESPDLYLKYNKEMQCDKLTISKLGG